MIRGALVDELRRAVASRRAICVAGAGVSISATDDPGRASWPGLLESGVQRALDVGRAVVDEEWAAEVRSKVADGRAGHLIAAAEQVESVLRRLPGNQFGKWLQQTVGSLAVVRPGLPHALAELGIPLATTNYDDILIRATGGEPITWREPGRLQGLLRGELKGVFHLHGHWQDPDSVVLGSQSYQRIIGDGKAQQHLRAMLAGYSVFFVGFGAGLADPNFLQLRDWIRAILEGSDFPPTVLVRHADLKTAYDELSSDNIQVVSYGAEHEELEIFVSDLRADSPSAEVDGVRAYDWDLVRIKLERLHMRIAKEFKPDVVVAMSGPGNFAPSFCMRLDRDETPVLTAVTFPKTSGRSERNVWFSGVASTSGWAHIESTKWDVFLPNVLEALPSGSKVLIFDDRAIGGNVQRMVADRLRAKGHEVRRAAIVVHPDIKNSVDWFEDAYNGDFAFPWGGRRGRS